MKLWRNVRAPVFLTCANYNNERKRYNCIDECSIGESIIIFIILSPFDSRALSSGAINELNLKIHVWKYISYDRADK